MALGLLFLQCVVRIVVLRCMSAVLYINFYFGEGLMCILLHLNSFVMQFSS